PGGHAFCHHLDHRADRRALPADAVEITLVEFRFLPVRAEERIAVDLFPVPARAVDRFRAHLDQRSAYRHAWHDLAPNRAGGNPQCGLARRLAAAAAIVAQAVFDVVGEVGVAGPVSVADVGIVLRALVDVLDQEPDRRPGRDLRPHPLVLEHAGQYPD